MLEAPSTRLTDLSRYLVIPSCALCEQAASRLCGWPDCASRRHCRPTPLKRIASDANCSQNPSHSSGQYMRDDRVRFRSMSRLRDKCSTECSHVYFAVAFICFSFMSLHHSDRITSEISIAWRYGRLSDHILPLLDVHQCAGYPVAMVLPYRAHQPLRDRMARMTLRQVQSYMRGLLIALSCMHKFNLIHRDGEAAHRRQRGRVTIAEAVRTAVREHAPNRSCCDLF